MIGRWLSSLSANILRSCIFYLGWVPLGPVFMIAGLAADIVFFLGIKQAAVHQNLEFIFGDELSRAEKRRIARAANRNAAFLFVEFLLSANPKTRRQVASQMTFDDPELMRSCDEGPRGVIFAVSHSGNFDLTGVWWTEFNKRPVGAIAKPLENEAFDTLMHESRLNRNIIVLSTKSPTVVQDVNALLRSGNNLCVLPDQNARTRGVAVDFLGKPASTYKGAAKTFLVNREWARLVVGVPTRIDGGRKHMVYVREIDDFEPTGDDEQDVKALTQRISTIMGERVREHPESYLWHHRRWHKPEKADLPKAIAPPA